MPDPNDPNDSPISNTPLFAPNEKIANVNVAEEIKNLDFVRELKTCRLFLNFLKLYKLPKR